MVWEGKKRKETTGMMNLDIHNYVCNVIGFAGFFFPDVRTYKQLLNRVGKFKKKFFNKKGQRESTHDS